MSPLATKSRPRPDNTYEKRRATSGGGSTDSGVIALHQSASSVVTSFPALDGQDRLLLWNRGQESNNRRPQRLAQESRWKDYEDVVILAVLNGVAKASAT